MGRGARLLATCFVLLAASAGADGPTYFRDVRPILERHCAICHDAANLADRETSGELALDSAAAIGKALERQILVAGKPDEGTLLARLTTADVEKRMPKDSDALDGSAIATIRDWIAAGAPLGEEAAPETPRRRQPRTPRVRSFRTLSVPTTATPGEGVFPGRSPATVAVTARMAPMAAVTAVALSPDGRYLAAGSFRRIVIWDLKRAQPARILDDPLGMVTALAFAPAGDKLWMSGGDPGIVGELAAYEIEAGSRAFHFSGSKDLLDNLAVFPDGKRVATIGGDGHLRIFAADRTEPTFEVKAHSDRASALAIAADGAKIATGGKDRVVKIWDAASGANRQVLSGHEQEVLAVAFAPDGSAVFSAGFEPALRKWDLAKGTLAATQGGQGGAVQALTWSPDHGRLASSSSDGSVFLWKPDGTPEGRLPSAGEAVYAASLGPGGALVAGGTWDGRVCLWNVASAALVATFLVADPEGSDSVAPARPDWLIVTALGPFHCSEAGTRRLGWTMGGAELPLDGLLSTLHRPADVVKILAGEAVDPIAFAASAAAAGNSGQ